MKFSRPDVSQAVKQLHWDTREKIIQLVWDRYVEILKTIFHDIPLFPEEDEPPFGIGPRRTS
jgi:hypothetical protein